MISLLLLRHAQAEPLTTTDHSRPLSEAGRQQCIEVAANLVRHGLIPQVVLCSDSVRTRQTWQLLAAELESQGALNDAPQVFYHYDFYDGGINDVVGAVAGVAEGTPVVLVVGHEPVMSGTAARLASPASDPHLVAQVRVGVSTATVCVLEVAALADLQGEELGRGQARLTQILRRGEH